MPEPSFAADLLDTFQSMSDWVKVSLFALIFASPLAALHLWLGHLARRPKTMAEGGRLIYTVWKDGTGRVRILAHDRSNLTLPPASPQDLARNLVDPDEWRR